MSPQWFKAPHLPGQDLPTLQTSSSMHLQPDFGSEVIQAPPIDPTQDRCSTVSRGSRDVLTLPAGSLVAATPSSLSSHGPQATSSPAASCGLALALVQAERLLGSRPFCDLVLQPSS